MGASSVNTSRYQPRWAVGFISPACTIAGANKNVNGLIRRYFPKRTDFDEVTEEQMQAIEQAINLRPRKRLGFRAPIEFIDQLIDLSDGCAVNT